MLTSACKGRGLALEASLARRWNFVERGPQLNIGLQQLSDRMRMGSPQILKNNHPHVIVLRYLKFDLLLLRPSNLLLFSRVLAGNVTTSRFGAVCLFPLHICMHTESVQPSTSCDMMQQSRDSPCRFRAEHLHRLSRCPLELPSELGLDLAIQLP